MKREPYYSCETWREREREILSSFEESDLLILEGATFPTGLLSSLRVAEDLDDLHVTLHGTEAGSPNAKHASYGIHCSCREVLIQFRIYKVLCMIFMY